VTPAAEPAYVATLLMLYIDLPDTPLRTWPARSSLGPQAVRAIRFSGTDRGGLAAGVAASSDPAHQSPAAVADSFSRILPTRDP
jgi:hypothetical protein